MGTLYYGDNLDILRRHLKDETVDLVYLDPPFNSAQNYNAFFQEKDGSAAASQIHAFEDTWHWDIETKKAYDDATEQPGKVSDVMQVFYTFLGGNDMMAYTPELYQQKCSSLFEHFYESCPENGTGVYATAE
jgi:site-specific DNA-methyltransferase (adenine-specific)